MEDNQKKLAFQLNANEPFYNDWGCSFCYDFPVTVIGEGDIMEDGHIKFHNIVQVVRGHALHVAIASSTPRLRKFCKEIGAEKIKLREGIAPFCPEDYISVLGTKRSNYAYWYVIPISVYNDFRSK